MKNSRNSKNFNRTPNNAKIFFRYSIYLTYLIGDSIDLLKFFDDDLYNYLIFRKIPSLGSISKSIVLRRILL